MSSLLAHHRPFLPDDTAPLRAHSFEPFDQPDDSLYTSPPVPRDTYAHDPSSDDYAPHTIHPADSASGLYSQPDSLVFRPSLEFTSNNNNPFQTSTAFSSAARHRQQQQAPPSTTASSTGALSHQSSLSALYGPDVPPFRSGVSSDLYAQQGPLDHQQGLLHQSSRLPLPNGFAESSGGGYDPYEYEPTPRGIRHQPSFGNGSSRTGASTSGLTNGSSGVNGGTELLGGPLPLQQAPTAAPLYVSNGGPTVASSYAASASTTTTGPTLRETLRDAREPRDSSVDARGLGGRDGGGGGAAGANGPGGQQEEISTIFVVGFPDDMQVSHPRHHSARMARAACVHIYLVMRS